MEKSSQQLEKQLLQVVHDFLIELKAERAQRAISINARLENDLGLGSLEKAELFSRLEKYFSVQLATQTMAEAKTLNDILIAISQNVPSQQIATKEIITPLSELEIPCPVSATSLVEILFYYAEKTPQRPHIYLQDENGDEKKITYGQLFNKATAMAHGLKNYGLNSEDTVAIMLPTCEDFFYVFFAVLLAGGVPVPIYPPFRADRVAEYAKREATILNNAETRILVTFHQGEILSKILKTFIPSLREIISSDSLLTNEIAHIDYSKENEKAALIQYTSGSTGDPKGVLLTHHNLLSNMHAAGKAANIQPTDIGVSWLPLYHDMGLIGVWFCPLYYGIPVTIMSPLSFLSRPERWLWTIHYHRATVTAGPNFAYELCIRKIDENKLQGLDLSCLRLTFNGAEAVRADTIRNFTKKFAPYGFKPETMYPVYGLAESTVALLFPELNQVPRFDKIERDSLQKEGKAVPSASKKSKNFLEFVCVGKPIPDHEVRIVDEADQVVPERVVGQLQFCGPSAMQGYYHNPKTTQAIYHNGWWDSGDYAYQAEGDYFITGRKKDLIIKAGRNIYPEAIEEIVGHIEGIRKGCVIAFGVSDENTGTEKLIVVAETRAQQPAEREQLLAEITDNILSGIGVAADKIILAKPGTIPKTSSGKLQRSACKYAYLQSKLAHHRMPSWLQITKLFLQGIANRIKSFINAVLHIIYGIYIGMLLMLIAPVMLLCSFILSAKRLAKLVKMISRTLLFLAGCRISVIGKENLSQFNPVIIVANHASYADILLLLAILPPEIIFIGKKELLKTPIIKRFFKKLENISVDRLDFTQSLEDTHKIKLALDQKRSLIIFPEGTFTYATGLRPFKYGAFKVAVETNTPVCPIALSGTRQFLRDGTRIPKRGNMKVTICEPIVPTEQGWHEIIRLATSTRLEIAKYCGEQAIDLVMAGVELKK